MNAQKKIPKRRGRAQTELCPALLSSPLASALCLVRMRRGTRSNIYVIQRQKPVVIMTRVFQI